MRPEMDVRRALVAEYRAARHRYEVREAAAAARLILETVPGPDDPRVAPVALEAKRFAERQLGLDPIPLRWAPATKSWWGEFAAPPPRILLAADLSADRAAWVVLHEVGHFWSWLRSVPGDDEDRANAIASHLFEQWEKNQ